MPDNYGVLLNLTRGNLAILDAATYLIEVPTKSGTNSGFYRYKPTVIIPYSASPPHLPLHTKVT
jgi:hypothetical protein